MTKNNRNASAPKRGKVQKVQVASDYRDRQDETTTVLQLCYKQRVKDDSAVVCEI